MAPWFDSAVSYTIEIINGCIVNEVEISADHVNTNTNCCVGPQKLKKIFRTMHIQICLFLNTST